MHIWGQEILTPDPHPGGHPELGGDCPGQRLGAPAMRKRTSTSSGSVEEYQWAEVTDGEGYFLLGCPAA